MTQLVLKDPIHVAGPLDEFLYRSSIVYPVEALQTVLDGRPKQRAKQLPDFYAGGLVAHAGEMFAEGLRQAAVSETSIGDWSNVTAPEQLARFAENTTALL